MGEDTESAFCCCFCCWQVTLGCCFCRRCCAFITRYCIAARKLPRLQCARRTNLCKSTSFGPGAHSEGVSPVFNVSSVATGQKCPLAEQTQAVGVATGAVQWARRARAPANRGVSSPLASAASQYAERASASLHLLPVDLCVCVAWLAGFACVQQSRGSGSRNNDTGRRSCACFVCSRNRDGRAPVRDESLARLWPKQRL